MSENNFALTGAQRRGSGNLAESHFICRNSLLLLDDGGSEFYWAITRVVLISDTSLVDRNVIALETTNLDHVTQMKPRSYEIIADTETQVFAKILWAGLLVPSASEVLYGAPRGHLPPNMVDRRQL